MQGQDEGFQSEPRGIAELKCKGVVALAAGKFHSAALKDSGQPQSAISNSRAFELKLVVQTDSY